MVSRALALALLWLAASLGVAHAEQASCDNPQDAARSLLDFQLLDPPDLAQAAKCLDVPQGMVEPPEELARKLKIVLDARGLYVPTDDLPLDPDYADAQGLHRVAPIPSFPLLSIEKREGRWVYARELVRATPELYEAVASLQTRIEAWLPARLRRMSLAGVAPWQVIYFTGLLALAVFMGLFAQKILADRFIRLAGRLGVQLDTRALAGTRWPLTWVAMGGVFVWGLPEAQLRVQTSGVLLFLANAVTSIAAVLVLSRLVDVGADFFAKRAARTHSKLDDQVIPLVSRAVKTTIWVVGIVFVIQNLGIDVGSLIAGLGIGGLAFALAAKDTASNLFGSLTIFTDRPFQIGDWVVLGGSTEGVVEEVGFRSTRVRTFKGSVVSVPNAKVANETIDNIGQRPYRRVSTTLGLTYGTTTAQMEAFVADARAAIDAHPAVAQGAAKEVHFKAFGPSSLDVMVYCFLDVPSWTAELEAKQSLFLDFMRIAERRGVSFAFPSTSVYVESLPPGAAGPFA